MWTGEFSKNRDTVLAAGPGQLVGTVTCRRRAGRRVRLRLMLNGSVTEPMGRKRRRGEIHDRRSLRHLSDRRLRDRSSMRRTWRLRERSTIPGTSTKATLHRASAERPGRALNLDFVDPVRKSSPLGEVSRSSRSSSPGSRIPALGLPGPAPRMEGMGLAPRDRPTSSTAHPVLKEPSFNPAEHGVELHKGSYYSLTIDAMTRTGGRSHRAPATSTCGRPDFRVID